MRRFSLSSVVLLAGLTFFGCNKSGDSMPAASIPGDSSQSPSALTNNHSAGTIKLPANAGPDVVVSTFLDATRAGNEAAATDLLTSKAREETAKEGLTLDPPGTPSMQYKIAKVEFLEDNKDAAYVNSIWTESQGDIQDSFEVVWVLRRQLDGWRIAGMAASTVPEEPPVFLNFEDPIDVVRIKNQISQGEPSGEPAPQQPAATAAQNPGPTATFK